MLKPVSENQFKIVTVLGIVVTPVQQQIQQD